GTAPEFCGQEPFQLLRLIAVEHGLHAHPPGTLLTVLGHGLLGVAQIVQPSLLLPGEPVVGGVEPVVGRAGPVADVLAAVMHLAEIAAGVSQAAEFLGDGAVLGCELGVPEPCAPHRPWCRPAISPAREGLHTGAVTYACGQVTPFSASWSRCGVSTAGSTPVAPRSA